jgi:TolB protein
MWSYAAIDTVYLEHSAAGLELPLGIIPFQLEGSAIPELTEKPHEIFIRDLSLSGRFKPVISDKVDVSFLNSEGASFFIHGKYYQNATGEIVIECRMSATHNMDLVLGKVYTVNIKGYRKAIHDFSDRIVYQFNGEPGVASTSLAFVTQTSKGKQIAVSDYDGYNPHVLTSDQNINTMPVWFPDNRNIAYVSFKSGAPGIYQMDIFTGKSKSIFSNMGHIFSPAISPDGSKIAFTTTKEGGSDIWVGNLKTAKAERLTYHWAVETSPEWSPNGREIVYSSDRTGNPQLYAMDELGGNNRRITFMGSYNESASWSPKGDRIAFCSMDKGLLNIYTATPQGKDITQLTTAAGNNESPVWSPDGQLIAFSSTRSGASQIYIMRKDGSQVTQVTKNGSNTLPNWSFNNLTNYGADYE